MRTRPLVAGIFIAVVTCAPTPDPDPDPPAVSRVTSAASGPVNVSDAIEMVRIEDWYGLNDGFVTFSPDGSKFAAVVWRGDLERNSNIYSIIVFDVEDAIANPQAAPVPVLSTLFDGDSTNQAAAPIEQLSFLADNRTITFIGTLNGEPKQVYAVDVRTGKLRALTDHPTPVKIYSVAADGRLKIYGVASPDDADTARVNRYNTDGFSPFDGEMILPHLRLNNVAAHTIRSRRVQEIRQYFAPASGRRDEPSLIFDSRQSRRLMPSIWERKADTATHALPRGNVVMERELERLTRLSVDPTGRYAVLWPYLLGEHSIDTLQHAAWDRMNLYARSLAAFFGLVNLQTGEIEPLLDQLYVPFFDWRAGQIWAADGSTVLIKVLPPLDASTAEENEQRAQEPPSWLEIEIPSQRYSRVPVPDGWRPIRWDQESTLILRSGRSFGTMRKEGGLWGELQEIGISERFNARRPVATNGRIAVGIVDSLTAPPELAAYDLETGELTVLTDLNPQLRNREYGKVEKIQFATEFDSASTAWMIRPTDFQPGRRYPLVMLFSNTGANPANQSYLLDGRMNLSGHAVQPLSALGFVVLFLGVPPNIPIGTPMEGEVVRATVEAAIRSLARDGLVDTTRVGISGWSRSGYHTDYMLIHSDFPFAAASQIDGGTSDYSEGMRPYWDEELRRIDTPLLFQPHGPSRLIWAGSMADRMKAMGKPIDLLYFHTAPHSTVRPRHRWRSLTTHIDWWRFWLQNYEDPDPDKKDQYRRWRGERDSWQKGMED